MAQDAVLKPNPAVVSIEILGKTPKVGSGLVVSDTGLIVTSFTFLSAGDRAQVTFVDGSKQDVAGYVAAREGKDLVVLALKKKLHGLPFLDPVRKPVAAGTPVLLHSGPRSAPFVMASTTVTGIPTGDILQSGRVVSDAAPLDADSCWLIADSFVPDTGIGGAMLDAEGRLVGMMTPDVDRSDRSHSAIHADHIAQLLETVETKTKPLASLKRYDDTPPSGLPVDPAEPVVLPATVERTQPIAAWVEGLRNRLLSTEAELPTFRQREDGIRATVKEQIAREQELIKQQNLIAQEKNNIRPEVPVKRVVRVTANVPDKDGKLVPRNGNVDVVEYQFSLRQKQQLAALDVRAGEVAKQLAGVQIDVRLNEFRFEQSATDRSATERRLAHLWNELFLMSDPLEVRHDSEARAALAELSKVTDKLGSNGRVLLAKAMFHLRLREFPACLQAADQADDLDKSVALPVQALRARCAYLKGDEGDASRLVAKLGRGANEDVRVQLILARYELDRANFTAAIRHVKQAGEQGADSTEVETLLGLLYATAPHKASGDVPRAMEHSGRACQATLWKDWRSMTALAASLAAGKNFSTAREVLKRAGIVAGAEYANDFAGWEASLEASEPIRFPWK